jgi:integrase
MNATPTMEALVEEYLVRRRALGFALTIDASQLRNFARFADAEGHSGPLTVDLITRWAMQPGRRVRRFPGRRLDSIRQFARDRASVDPTNEVPSAGLLGPPRRRGVRHIYTEEQLVAILAEARKLRPAGGLRPLTYATLFGLLSACGLRISEALRLTCADVDLNGSVLVVRMTKFRKSRLVPLHPTTAHALRSYEQHRDGAVPRRKAAAFFVTKTGRALPYPTVHHVFQNLRVALGWDGAYPLPRIHDIRHTFACRRLCAWYTAGVDAAAQIAALATYLGHAHITDTYWYLTASPELLALAARRFELFATLATPAGAP